MLYTDSIKIPPRSEYLIAAAFHIEGAGPYDKCPLEGRELRKAILRHMPRCEDDIEPIRLLAIANMRADMDPNFGKEALPHRILFVTAAWNAGWTCPRKQPHGGCIWRTPRGAHYSETRGWC